MVRLGLPVIVLLLLAAPAAAQPTLERVVMRDGTALATDVWLPAGPVAPMPVLLRRTPYGRTFDAGAAQLMATLGYILVSQDVRGRGDSEGVFSPFRDDARDGFDTIAWIAAQDWSNERVGMFSASAEGIVQLMAASAAPPALRCAIPVVATDDMHEALYPGGAWREELGTAWLEALEEPEALVEMRSHEADDDFWAPARMDADERARVTFPILLIGGFYDIFARGTSRAFGALRAGADPGARGDQFLLLGPWTHGGVSQRLQGEVTYAAEATFSGEDLTAEEFAFFDFCLQGGPRPAWAPARYFVTRLSDDGAEAQGEWRNAETWPPASAPVELALHDDGTLRAGPLAADGASAALDSDPAAPVPSVGGGNLTTPAGPFDQSELDARPDVLYAQTAPVVEEVELAGDVTARITAASATDDVDVIVRLSQVVPGGRAMLLADGIRRGRFAQGLDAPRPLVPDQPTVFDVELGPVAVVLPPGHALRVAVQATSSPRYEPNPGTSDPIATAVPVATTLTVFRDLAGPSVITLPVARGTLPGSPEPEPDAGPSLPDAGGAGPDAGPDAGPGPAGGSGGCDCRTAGPPRPGPAAPPALLALLALPLVVLVGRRRARQPGSYRRSFPKCER